jgi:hypothetical protein
MSRLAVLPSSNISGKGAVFTSKQGIPYDGDISMFSDEHIAISAGVNYFDIYLGQLNLI